MDDYIDNQLNAAQSDLMETSQYLESVNRTINDENVGEAVDSIKDAVAELERARSG